jgi:hypothetical protein
MTRVLPLLLLSGCSMFNPLEYPVSDYESQLDKVVYESMLLIDDKQCYDVCLSAYTRMDNVSIYLLSEFGEYRHCFVCDGEECRDNGYLSFSSFTLDEAKHHGDIKRIF